VTPKVPPYAAPLVAVDHLDEVVLMSRGWRVRATKVVDPGDPYLGGHFPGRTVFPGVFIIEAVRQAVAAALDQPLDVASVRSVRFLAPALAGDELVMDAEVDTDDEPGRPVVRARVSCADGPCATVHLTLRPLTGDDPGA
jgi:3-hydroxymyristoyl/3-hydroxydecanoyl-(acyl carrier protein) dehydratase